jgi:hypothetical protein
MSEQIQRQEVGFSLLSDLLKVFQPTTRTESRYEPPQVTSNRILNCEFPPIFFL